MKIEKLNKTEYRLLESLGVVTKDYLITIDEGFVFDGASIPRVFWSIIGSPFTGKYTEAALVHDALYASEVLPREEADEVFLELMQQAGVSYLKRYTMYWAVRAGGWKAWKDHNEDQVKEDRRLIDVQVIDS